MLRTATIRRVLTATLALTLVLWTGAGLALVDGDQVMQCSMSAHEMQAMGDMPCCPGREMLTPAMTHERPLCCSVSNAPERPLAVEVGYKQVKSQQPDGVSGLPGHAVEPIAQSRGDWLRADVPNFVRPVLELKTDLRI
jgi:hypothetical protein